MAAERKLGRGLDSLLGEARAHEGEEILSLGLDQVHRSPHQPRHDFDEVALEELAASIRANGVLQPIIVRPGAVGYEIVAGERRARAARLAGLTSVPAIVRRYSDEDTLVLSLVENIQRADLNAIDRASAYRRLVSHLNVTQDEVARRLGLDPSSVSNMIRLLDLPPEVQELVRGGALSMGHARAILGLSAGIDRVRLAERAIREELSVRAVERLIREGETAPKRRVVPRKPPQVMALEAELRGILGTKVRIEDRRGKGRIVIDYYTPEEFERIVDALRGERGFSRPEL
jgi:ParB family transcriptional regulator, chromosome partitioning protein